MQDEIWANLIQRTATGQFSYHLSSFYFRTEILTEELAREQPNQPIYIFRPWKPGDSIHHQEPEPHTLRSGAIPEKIQHTLSIRKEDLKSACESASEPRWPSPWLENQLRLIDHPPSEHECSSLFKCNPPPRLYICNLREVHPSHILQLALINIGESELIATLERPLAIKLFTS